MALVVSLTPEQHDALEDSYANNGHSFTLAPLLLGKQAQDDDEGLIIFLDSFREQISMFAEVKSFKQVNTSSQLFFPECNWCLKTDDPFDIAPTMVRDFARMVHGTSGKDGIIHGLEAHVHTTQNMSQCEDVEMYWKLMSDGAQQAKAYRDDPDFEAEARLEMLTRHLIGDKRRNPLCLS